MHCPGLLQYPLVSLHPGAHTAETGKIITNVMDWKRQIIVIGNRDYQVDDWCVERGRDYDRMQVLELRGGVQGVRAGSGGSAVGQETFQNPN